MSAEDPSAEQRDGLTQHLGPQHSSLESVAGEVGFEPTNGGSKGRCLTTWRLPNKL